MRPLKTGALLGVGKVNAVGPGWAQDRFPRVVEGVPFSLNRHWLTSAKLTSRVALPKLVAEAAEHLLDGRALGVSLVQALDFP